MIFFSQNRKLDLDMILGLDKYWKASPGSTLKGFNIGLAVFNDIDEFLTKFEPMAKSSQIKKFESFLKKYRKSSSELVKSP